MKNGSFVTFAAAALSLVLWQQPAHGRQQQQQPPKPAENHSAHAGAQAGAPDDCMTAQSKVSVTGATARGRLEEARQTNDPAKLRAAVDEALIAISSLLAATEPCRQAPAMGGMDHSTMAMPQPGAPVSPGAPAAAADPHAGMNMPAAPAKPGAKPATKPTDPHAGMNMPATPARPGAKSAAKPSAKPADPHAGMNMPAAPAKRPATRSGRSAQKPAPVDLHAGMTMPAAPGKTPAKPAAKAAPAKPGSKPEATPSDPHAGMNMTPTGGTTADDPAKLTCATPVDPDNAPTTTYKGKAYYFCSAADRLRFIMNPVGYLKGAGGK